MAVFSHFFFFFHDWQSKLFQINASSLKHIPVPNAIVTDSRRQPHITQSALELEIDSNTFEGGKARLQCVASLFHLYKREVELIVEEEKPRPRPSSELRTRDAAGKAKAPSPRKYKAWQLYNDDIILLQKMKQVI